MLNKGHGHSDDEFFHWALALDRFQETGDQANEWSLRIALLSTSRNEHLATTARWNEARRPSFSGGASGDQSSMPPGSVGSGNTAGLSGTGTFGSRRTSQ